MLRKVKMKPLKNPQMVNRPVWRWSRQLISLLLLVLFLLVTSLGGSGQATFMNFLPLVANAVTPAPPVTPPPTGPEWSTVAGNPQRTSAVSGSVTGNLNVEWYRPIEAYIPQNVQLIAAAGMIYVSTARGLYALNADTGEVNWRFDSDMPIGNSPTVSDGIVYVAGFDRKVHALNAMTGAQVWEFTGAAGGYDANPLVTGGMVIIGNHDGYLYALDAGTGRMVWRYGAGSPIRYTAAYLNGVIYFAANDNSAYAVNIDGSLKWKSQKLPGDGFQSYWPVAYHDNATGKDLVVFSGSSAYRFDVGPGSFSVQCLDYNSTTSYVPCDSTRFYTDYMFFDKSADPNTPVGPTVQINEPWAAGKTVLDYSRIAQIFEANPKSDPHLYKPWLRFYFVLNASDGTEFTYDSNHDGYPEYAPIVPFGTNSGDAYPPVLGPDGMLYFSNFWQRNQQGRVMGWRTGTQYVTLAGAQGDTGEPQALSVGGNSIYRSICCDRVGDWFNLNNLDENGFFWHYIKPLTEIAPGYDSQWWFVDPTFLDRLTGNFGDVNGVYHNHGDQNPIIPYNGRVYIHRSNAVIAFGNHAPRGRLPLLTAQPVSRVTSTPTTAELTARLTGEVSKMIAAGHLRPGYYNAGQFNIYSDLVDYFDNPGQTIYTLAMAYPHVSPAVQPQLRTYLQNEFRAYFDPVMYSNIGWADGAARESSLLPPEVTADMKNYPKDLVATPHWSWQYPQYNFYAMWKYATIFPQDARRAYDLAVSKLQMPPDTATDDFFARKPYELNGYITGYIGFLELQKLAGRDTIDVDLKNQYTAELNLLQQKRANNFSVNTYYTTYDQGYTRRTLNIARNFLMLSPELGTYLNQHALNKVQTAVNDYNKVGPYWFVARYTASIGESGMQNMYDVGAMFQAKAYILKQNRTELTKYLDAPGFERGDLFYIQNLVAALQAP